MCSGLGRKGGTIEDVCVQNKTGGVGKVYIDGSSHDESIYC